MRDSTLQTTALRYAAGDLSPGEVEAFELRLAEDQAARDALSEAVRLSAAAIGQASPVPDPSFRALIRTRLGFGSRSRPLLWAGLGAAVVAVCALFAVSAADRAAPAEEAVAAPITTASEPLANAPAPDSPAAPDAVAPEHPAGACNDEQRSVAEIWADLSSHEGVEKAHEDEMKWRQRVRDPHGAHATKADGP